MSAIPADAPLEAQSALLFRKNLFQTYNPHFRGVYAARDDYLKGLGWFNIPLELAPAIHSQATVLLDLAKDSPFLSCVIGIAPAHSLKMQPHGDSRSPSDIASASLRFVLEPPCPQRMPTFHADFRVALEKFRLLQSTIPASSEVTASHPFLREGKDELSFCHPLFVHSGQYPLVTSITALQVPSDFQLKAYRMGLTNAEQRSIYEWPLPERARYPIDYAYQETFMNVDQELVLQHPVIEAENTAGSIAIKFAQDRMQDALVAVLFHLGAGVDGSLVAHFREVQLLTMLAP